MQNGLSKTAPYSFQEKYAYKKIIRTVLLIAAFMMIFLFSACLRTDGKGFINPADIVYNSIQFIKYHYYKFFNNQEQYDQLKFIHELTDGSLTVTNINSVLITALAGAILSLSGAVYQIIFRNPLAAPTLLGVSSGIQAGLLILVLKYSTAAILMVKEQYIYSYGFGLGVVGIVFLFGQVIQKNRNSVTDMLLIGVILSQLISIVFTYYEVTLPLDQLEMLQNFTLGRLSSVSGLSLKIFLLIIFFGIIPLFLLRFSVNALSLGFDQAKTMGINVYAVQSVCLLSATILVAASIIHCGSIGVISLIIPFICRHFFGSDFKNMFFPLLLSGSALLMVCRDITNALSSIFGYIPVGVFVSLISSPIFVFILLKQRRDD